MTWTFDEGLALSKDKVRSLIGDTDTTDQILSDEQINLALKQTASLFSAAALACEMAASKFARDVSIQIDGFSESASHRVTNYRELATTFRQRDAESTSFDSSAADPFADADFDPDSDPIFSVGMFDNPGAAGD